jgi:integrase
MTETGLKRMRLPKARALLRDGGGLRLDLRESDAGRTARAVYRFRLGGPERDLYLGTWPSRTLAELRDLRDKARDLVRRGIDPRDKAREAKAAAARAKAEKEASLTVRGLFERWAALHLARAYKDGGKEPRRYFEKDILPALGDLPAEDLSRAHVARVVDAALERGSPRTAALNLTYLRQLARWGMARGYLDSDPTAALRKSSIPTAGMRERVLSDAEIGELARRIPDAGLPQWTPPAIWLLLATAARSGELLRARWADVDLQAGEWHIPAENSKNARAHLVHLSAFARARFGELLALRESEWVTPGRTPGRPVEEKAIAHLLRDRQRTEAPTRPGRRPGRRDPIARRTEKHARALVLQGGPWTAHDLRRTAATLMQTLGVLPAVIEKTLNHTEPRRVVATYQRAEYLPERRDAFERLGAHLERLAAGEAGTVTTLRRAGRS